MNHASLESKLVAPRLSGGAKHKPPQAPRTAAIQQGDRVLYREAHTLLEELTEATLSGARKPYFTDIATVPLLIINDLGIRKLPHTAPRTCWNSSCGATSARPRC